jgi:raffinose/stachyose/melibiose transport system substrate-binding protein
MKTLRKITGSVMGLAVAGLGLAACSPGGPGAASSGGSGSGSGSSVVIWTTSQPSSAQAVVASIIKKFNKSYPGGGNVSIDWIGGESWKTKTAVAMADHHPPTVFYTFGGQLLDQYIQDGDVANLSPALNSDPAWKKQYTARNVFDLATYKGNIYAIPATGPDFELMWENKSVVQKAGGVPAPATWAQFLDDVRAIKKTGASPITLAGNDLWPEMIYLQYLTLRHGGPGVFDKISQLQPGSWSNPAVLAAAKDVQQLAQMNAFEPGFAAVTFNSGSADQLLAAGKAGFEAQLYYDEANMRVYAPSFAASSNYVPSKFPSVSGGTGDPGDVVGQPAEYYGVSAYASAAQKKEALAFLKYMTTSMTYNVNYLEDQGYTPITQPGADYLLTGKVPNGALLHKIYELAVNAPYFQPYWDQDLPSAVITPMLTAIGELFNQSITPQQFVTQMNKVTAQQRGKN